METIYLKWPITSICNLNCIFCNNKHLRGGWPDELNDIELKKFIQKINTSKYISGITISGGEPTRSKNFIKACKLLNKDFGFITSGVDLIDEKFNVIFNNKSLKFITLSIDCLNQETVKLIRGKDILEKQLNALEKLLKYKEHNPGFKIFINTVITNLNVDCVKDLILKLGNMNVDRIQLFKFYPTGNLSIDNSLTLSEDKEKDITKDIVELYIDNKDIWNQNNFEISIRFTSASVANYWEKFYNMKLPFRSKGCSIYDNTVHLNTDTKLNLCKSYYKDIKWKYIKNIKFSELDLDNIVPKLLLKTKETIFDKEKFKQFSPCFECKLLFKTCFPCVELSRDDSVYVNVKECNKFLNIIKESEQITN